MRIVHAIARLNVGGAALSVLELAAEQRKRGHDVVVVAGRVPPGEASMEHVAEELDVPYVHLASLTRNISLGSDIATLRALRSLLQSDRVDVLHTHTAKAGTTGRIAALLSGRRRPRGVIHTFHGHVLTGYFDPVREHAFRLVERALAYATDRVIAVSEEVRDDLVRLKVAPRSKIDVVPYGFDLNARLAVEKPADTEAGDAFVVGWAGRLTAIKRPLDLVETLALVDDAVLVIAGDGELRSQVELRAHQLGFSDRVRVLGYVPNIAAWYAAFDALLLTSANEGTPVVAIEALAAGVPVVATDAGGTRAVVDDGETGYLVPVGDVQALADRLRRLRDDPELRARFGSAGAVRMRERFSIATMTDRIDAIYDEVTRR